MIPKVFRVLASISVKFLSAGMFLKIPDPVVSRTPSHTITHDFAILVHLSRQTLRKVDLEKEIRVN